jgi:ubiquinone/menaquinone biosynthesis C-methylase UbiE
MDIKELQENWNKLGKNDPLWAILNNGDTDMRGNQWQIEEFFQTGIVEIARVSQYIDALGIHIPSGKALDFGCGVGRLTQALADHFDQVCGVDIAPAMIELANKYNRHGSKCQYYLNESDDLKLFADNNFDFIYSNIVLQHMEPRYSKNYLKEFLRILTPQGLLIFQLPSHPAPGQTRKANPVRILFKRLIPGRLLAVCIDVYIRIRYVARTEVYGIPQEKVVQHLEANGGKIVDIVQDQGGGSGWTSFRYCVTKATERTDSPLPLES